MKLLSRYIARSFLKYWILGLAALVLLFIISNLFGNLDSILSSRAGVVRFVNDTVRSLPTVLALLIPMTTLLATLFTFNALSRTSELVAMQSAGVGLQRQLRPIGVVLIFIAALVYCNQNYFYRQLHKGDLAPRLSNLEQWTALHDQIIYADLINAAGGSIADVHIFQWAADPFRLQRLARVQRISRRAKGPWHLKDVVVRTRQPDRWDLQHAPSQVRPKEDFPDLFDKDVPDAHHMPLFELSSRIRQLQSQGQRVEVYELEWYQKTAAMFAPFALVWFAMPLAQAYHRRGRASGEIMVGILGGLFFLIATQIVFTLGKGGYLSPFVAAWAVNGVYIVLGSALMWRVR